MSEEKDIKMICFKCGGLAIAVRKKKTFFGKIRYYNVCPKHCICTDIPIIPNPYLQAHKSENGSK